MVRGVVGSEGVIKLRCGTHVSTGTGLCYIAAGVGGSGEGGGEDGYRGYMSTLKHG